MVEDRWPYPVSQAMQRQTGSGHKAARPAPEREATADHSDRTQNDPGTARSNACQSGRQSKD